MGQEKKLYRQYNDFIFEEAAIAMDMFQLYVGLYNSRIAFLDEQNVAPAFFQMVTRALLENSVLRVAKLYERDSGTSQTITLIKLINNVEQNAKKIKPNTEEKALQIVNDVKKKIQDREAELGKLKTLRDRALTHNDKMYYMRDIWAEVGLSTGSIVTLIELVAEISNEFKNLYERKTTRQKIGRAHV